MAYFEMNYFSPTLGFGTDLEIFVPTPNSDEILNDKDSSYFQEGTKFPVLYLLHGAYGDCTDWMRLTGVERYAQEKKIVLVTASVDNSFYQDMYRGSSYYTYISEEVPRYMERLFPISQKKEHTFIAGLSMGGYGALHIAFSKPEKYGAVISLSGAIDITSEILSGDKKKPTPFIWDSIFQDSGSIQETDADLFHQLQKLIDGGNSIPRIFQSCGTEDFLHDMNLKGYARMKEMGAEITYDEAPGKHDWNYWDAGILRALDWLNISSIN